MWNKSLMRNNNLNNWRKNRFKCNTLQKRSLNKSRKLPLQYQSKPLLLSMLLLRKRNLNSYSQSRRLSLRLKTVLFQRKRLNSSQNHLLKSFNNQKLLRNQFRKFTLLMRSLKLSLKRWNKRQLQSKNQYLQMLTNSLWKRNVFQKLTSLLRKSRLSNRLTTQLKGLKRLSRLLKFIKKKSLLKNLKRKRYFLKINLCSHNSSESKRILLKRIKFKPLRRLLPSLRPRKRN